MENDAMSVAKHFPQNGNFGGKKVWQKGCCKGLAKKLW